jgi:hypothetical protein
VGQGLSVQSHGDDTGSAGEDPDAKKDNADAKTAAEASGAAPWKRFILGTDEAIERFNHDHPELFPTRRNATPDSSPADGRGALQPPAQPQMQPMRSTSARQIRRPEVIDRAIEFLYDLAPSVAELSIRWVGETHQNYIHIKERQVGFTHPTDDAGSGQEERFDISAALALAATVAGEFYFRSEARRANTRPRIAGTYRRSDFLKEDQNSSHKGHKDHKEKKS